MKWLEAHVPTENAPQDYTDMLGRGFSGYREILRLDGAQQREVLWKKPPLGAVSAGWGYAVWQPHVPHGELAHSKPNLGGQRFFFQSNPRAGARPHAFIILCKEWGNHCEVTFWPCLTFLSPATTIDKLFPEVFQLFVYPCDWLYFQPSWCPWLYRGKEAHLKPSLHCGNLPRVTLTNIGHDQESQSKKNKISQQNIWDSRVDVTRCSINYPILWPLLYFFCDLLFLCSHLLYRGLPS